MGQLIFHSYLLYVFTNSGGIHYFIASGIVEKIELDPILVSYINIEISS